MLALLGSFEVTVVTVFWMISAGLVSFSVGVCVLLSLRRYVRNKTALKRIKHNRIYDQLIGAALNEPNDYERRDAILQFDGMSSAFTRSVLNVFRTVRGSHADALRAIIWNLGLEKKIIDATRKGSRGNRMRAVQVLSYLESEAAFDCIRAHLKSNNRYERLTAARALARRRSLADCSAVVASLASAFPRNTDLISEVLVGFGAGIQPGLEDIVRRSERKIVITACLKALVALSPATTSLDLAELARDPDSRVRASAIWLSTNCTDQSGEDLLAAGLSDNAIAVKIRSAKIACDIARRDLTPQLYQLTKDPSFWVRYWAIRAIWKLGRNGRQMVKSLAQGAEAGSEMAANVALEMEAAHG